MTIKVTYNVTDVYVTQDVSPVYINVSYSTGSSGGAAAWGGITGTLSNQTDLQSALDLKVPYTGATANVNLGEYEIKAGQVTLDTSPTGTAAVGTTRWNDTLGSSETTLKGGNVILKNGVDLVARVVNKVSPNTTLTKAAYQAVRVSGAQGQRLAVAFAQANNDNNSADTIGLVIETIATNQEGFIMTVGQIEGINTTGSLQGETWNDGDIIYLSPTVAGAVTNVKPSGGQHLVIIGYVEYAHAVNGRLYIKISNGWEITELHDVDVTSPANNEALIYESSSALWKNKSIATALGYTPANADTTLTINGVSYDLSTSRTWSVGSVTGSGALGQVAYWTGTSAQSGSNNLFWDNANGRLGIGTATPSVLLHVRGSYAGTLDSSIPQMLFENANTTAGADIFALSRIRIGNGYSAGLPEIWLQAYRSAAGVGSINLRVVSNHALLFSTNDSERMRIFAGGNIGIGTGTTDSGQRLQVQGTTLLNGNVTFSSATGMFWDATNSRLGIGTNAPARVLSVTSATNGSAVRIEVPASNSSLYDFYLGNAADSNYIRYNPFILEFNRNGAASTIRTIGSSNDLLLQSSRNLQLAINAGTIAAQLYSTGNLLIQNGGTFSDSGERLQVTGTMKVTGNVAVDTNTLFVDTTNKRVGIGTASPSRPLSVVGLASVSSGVLTPSINTEGSTFNFGGASVRTIVAATNPDGFALNIDNSGTGQNRTSGTLGAFNTNHNFAPTSGNSTYTGLNIANVINQTGGANGITRGLYVNPTLTSAADFRAIETARGNIVFGNLPTSSAGLPTGAIWNDAGTIKIV